MGPDASAYAALGLEPGADASAVERAYKRLIKQYHPDREGGDGTRAAEINRAYRQLRSASDQDDELFVHEVGPGSPGMEGIRWGRAMLFGFAAVGSLVLFSEPASRAIDKFWRTSAASPQVRHSSAARQLPDALDQPIAASAVEAGIRDAARITRDYDEMALAAASRECHHQLRVKPSVAQLDRCAAFDDAVVQLQDRDPLRDQGPFSEIAVTGRQMSGATIFSNDYLAIDGRLSRIRLLVETALARQADAEPDGPVD
jgi:hypothetical protein